MMTYKLDSLCSRYKFRYTSKLLKECENLGLIKNVSDGEIIIKNRLKQLRQYTKQLDELLKIPMVEQKTEIWYDMRQNLITASDFAQALGDGKFGSVKQFYQKKCEPSNDDATTSKVNPLFKWGNMFESVAISVYSTLYNVEVHNFGLLKHPNYSFFGASPDGISELGIMVEIKCPKKRKIDGDVPLQYYYQIQGQLDVCNLEECDYFECDFGTCDDKDNFLERDCINGFFGIIVEVKDNVFEYSEIGLSKTQCIDWNNKYDESLPRTYWYLNQFNIKRVYRDPVFIKEKMILLKEVWDKIQFYRKNRKAYEMEVLCEFSIETKKYKEDKGGESAKQNLKLTGWSFIEDS